MTTDAPDPELSIPDPTPGDMAALAELIEIGMVVARALGQAVAAKGVAGEAEGNAFDLVSRAVRRTAALRQQFHLDSLKTSEQRHAETLRRIEAQARALTRDVRVKDLGAKDLGAKDLGAKNLQTPEAKGDGEPRREPGEREDLLCDLRECLRDAGIAAADTPEKRNAIILGAMRDVGIVPRDAILSDAAMAHEIHRWCAAMTQAEATGTWPDAPAMELPKPGPGSPFYDPPESEWPPEILGRPPVDLFATRPKARPPDTG